MQNNDTIIVYYSLKYTVIIFIIWLPIGNIIKFMVYSMDNLHYTVSLILHSQTIFIDGRHGNGF